MPDSNLCFLNFVCVKYDHFVELVTINKVFMRMKCCQSCLTTLPNVKLRWNVAIRSCLQLKLLVSQVSLSTPLLMMSHDAHNPTGTSAEEHFPKVSYRRLVNLMDTNGYEIIVCIDKGVLKTCSFVSPQEKKRHFCILELAFPYWLEFWLQSSTKYLELLCRRWWIAKLKIIAWTQRSVILRE